MNQLILHGSVDSIPFYNCTWKPEEEWWKTGMKRPLLGVPITILGVIIEFLYVPILYIIFKTKLIHHSCYKLIVMLVITDMAATVCSCLISGVLFIQGAVFCVYPTFIYIFGSFGVSAWCAACAVTVFLFLNRVVSIGLHRFGNLESRMAYLSIVLVIVYFFYMWFFNPPACFNLLVIAWLPDPLSEQFPSEQATLSYRNHAQTRNNWVFLACMFFLYAVYCTLVHKLARGERSKAARSIFIQCSIICFFNTISALLYNLLSFVTPDPWILTIGQICWSINHGCPALIYITMNETIRREFKRLVFRINHTRTGDTSNTAPKC